MSKLTIVAAAAAAVIVPSTASAHRSGCHSHHSCPSDHATYRWQGRLCVKPGAPEQTSAFRHRVSYGGLRYLCK